MPKVKVEVTESINPLSSNRQEHPARYESTPYYTACQTGLLQKIPNISSLQRNDGLLLWQLEPLLEAYRHHQGMLLADRELDLVMNELGWSLVDDRHDDGHVTDRVMVAYRARLGRIEAREN
jgi:hypothetical protein